VYIEFRTTRLERCYRERREREKAWGKVVARAYLDAVTLLKAVAHPADLGGFPQYRYEPLTQDRKGQHSLALGYRVRLIFTVREGGKALIVRIEEVSTTHYGH